MENTISSIGMRVLDVVSGEGVCAQRKIRFNDVGKNDQRDDMPHPRPRDTLRVSRDAELKVRKLRTLDSFNPIRKPC